MAVLCLLTNTPWPWPTPAEAASARGGFPTLGTEWRGRSEAEVCTSEARKIRVPLARARGGASQEGLVSLLGAERMRSHFVVAVAMGPALRAGTGPQRMQSGRRQGGNFRPATHARQPSSMRKRKLPVPFLEGFPTQPSGDRYCAIDSSATLVHDPPRGCLDNRLTKCHYRLMKVGY